MKDLDFDELDRAVSSLLGGDAVAVPEAANVPAPPEVVAVTTPEEAAAVSVVKKPMIERRSSGRFMDVMHASSDMKNHQKPAVSRQAATIAPLADVTVSAPAEAEPSLPVATEVTIEETAAVPDVDAHTFPDPLDFHNFSAKDSVVSDDVAVDTNDNNDHTAALDRVASELNELDGLIAEDATQVSVDTPFVNGTSIEKRPLGAFSVDTADADTSLLSVAAPAEEAEVHTEEPAPSTEEVAATDVEAVAVDATGEREAQTIPDVEVVPDELQSDIVAIEAAEVTSPMPTSTATTMAAGSISQQYAEKLSPVIDEPTPVFDTTQYHQPLKHGPKQKSGWVGVLIISVLIVAGIGAGAVMYFVDPLNLF